MKRLLLALFLFALFSGVMSQVAFAGELANEKDESESLYLKLDTTEKGTPLALKTSIITLKAHRKKSNVRVHLVGAIHFADKEYYQKLDSILAAYPLVLYEMVKPSGVDPAELLKKEAPDKSEKKPASAKSSPGESPLRFVAQFQKMVADTLGFDYQIDGIEYTRKNMSHCDMDSDRLLKEFLKGDDIESLIDDLIQSFFEQQSGKELGSMLALLFSKDKRLTLRRIVALEIITTISPDRVSIGQKSLIEARNNVVLDRLRREFDNGQKEIAVFYGAAHLPDFVKRLQEEYGFKTTNCQWIEAWNMRPRTPRK